MSNGILTEQIETKFFMFEQAKSCAEGLERRCVIDEENHELSLDSLQDELSKALDDKKTMEAELNDITYQLKERRMDLISALKPHIQEQKYFMLEELQPANNPEVVEKTNLYEVRKFAAEAKKCYTELHRLKTENSSLMKDLKDKEDTIESLQ